MSFQQQSNSFDPWVTQASQNLYGNAADWLNKNPWQGYSGPTSAAFGPSFTQAQDYLSGQLGQTNPYTTAGAGALQNAIGSIDPNASVQSYMSPYISAALQPTLDQIQQVAGQQNQQNNQAATLSGAYGGTAGGVTKALLDKATQQNIAGATGSAYNNAWNSALAQKQSNLQALMAGGTQLAGVGQQAFGQQSTLASLLAGMGSTQQQAGQQGIQNAMNLNTQNQTMPLNQYTSLAQILQGVPKNTQQTSFGFNQGQSQTQTPNNMGFSFLSALL